MCVCVCGGVDGGGHKKLTCVSFNRISFHKFSEQLIAFSLCSSSLISAFLVLSTVYLVMKVSFSPDIILGG